jgi:hypothetical protein
MQMVRTQQPTREGLECLLYESEKTSRWSCQSKPIRLVHHTSQTGRVTQIGLGHSLMKSLSDDKFALGPGHV